MCKISFSAAFVLLAFLWSALVRAAGLPGIEMPATEEERRRTKPGRDARGPSGRPRRGVLSAGLACAVAVGLLGPAGALQAQDAAGVPAGMVAPDQGRVARIAVAIEEDGIPADGQSPARLEVSVFDGNGGPAPDGTVVSFEASGGRFQLPDAGGDAPLRVRGDLDGRMPGFQVRTQGGRARAWLLAPNEPQAVRLRVSAGAVQAEGVIRFVPELREMIAVGLVEGVLTFDAGRPLRIEQASANDGFEDVIRRWSRRSGDGRRGAAARTAFFLKGKVRGDALLTMAFDSDKPADRALFRDLDPERWYPVYGDASVTGFDARSSSRLYLRLDKDRHYLLYGDFATGAGFSQATGQGGVASLRVRDLGQYNRALTGLRGHAEGERGVLNVFAANDDLRQVVEEFPGRGLSGPFTVSNASHAVIGTERVEVVVRDRNAPSRIVSVRPLMRFDDYTFEPFSGRILLTAPVPSVDADLNPVSLRITYEVSQGGESFWVYGADGQYRPGGPLEFGGSVVRDHNPLAPYRLESANATVRLGERTWLRGEVARTRSRAGGAGGTIYTLVPGPDGDAAVSGDAWRAELGHEGERLAALAWYGQSDAAFNNPASSWLGGRRQAGIDAEWVLADTSRDGGAAEAADAADAADATEGDGRRWTLYAQGSYIEDRIGDARRGQAQAGVRRQAGALRLEAGLSRVSERAGDAVGNGLVVPGNIAAPYGIGVVSPGLGGGFFGGTTTALTPGTGQTLYNTGSSWSTGYGSWVGNGLAGVPVEYTALRLAAAWQVSRNWQLGGDIEQDIIGSDFRRAGVGIGWQADERLRLYGRYERNTGLATVATRTQGVDPLTGEAVGGANRTSAFVFGAESEYMPGGTVFGEYRMYDAFSARQAQWASGVRNHWLLSETLGAQASVERLKSLAGDGQSTMAVAGAVQWRPSERWQTSARLEWRRSEPGAGARQQPAADPGLPVASWLGESFRSWLSTVTVARKLSRDWTAIARNYYLLNDYAGALRNSYENRLQGGLAWRDTDTNRFNALFRYEYWTRRDATMALWADAADQLAPSDGFDKHIVSLHTDWHPQRNWWLSNRLAAKRQTDRFGAERDRYTAWLAGGRLTYDISERWDVSGLLYRFWSPGHARQHAIGVEAGYLVTQNLWLSAGYNVLGFREPDMSGSDYTRRGLFVRLRFKFDETLFGGMDPAINPALPR